MAAQWRVYLEGIALGAVVVEAESEEEALEQAHGDHLESLVDAYDVRAVSAVELEAEVE